MFKTIWTANIEQTENQEAISQVVQAVSALKKLLIISLQTKISVKWIYLWEIFL